MKVSNWAFYVLILFLFTACRTTEPTPQRTKPVEFFREGRTPTRQYDEMKTLYSENWAGEEQEAIEDLTEQAKDLGADAIMMLPRVEGDYKWNAFGRSGRLYTYKAVALRWSDDAPQTQPAP